jgi:hypothetical protein
MLEVGWETLDLSSGWADTEVGLLDDGSNSIPRDTYLSGVEWDEIGSTIDGRLSGDVLDQEVALIEAGTCVGGGIIVEGQLGPVVVARPTVDGQGSLLGENILDELTGDGTVYLYRTRSEYERSVISVGGAFMYVDRHLLLCLSRGQKYSSCSRNSITEPQSTQLSSSPM